jgi:hypothetical protein
MTTEMEERQTLLEDRDPHTANYEKLIEAIRLGSSSEPFTFDFKLLKQFGWLDIESAAFSYKKEEGFYDRREMSKEEEDRVERYLCQLAHASHCHGGKYNTYREHIAESWNIAFGADTLDGELILWDQHLERKCGLMGGRIVGEIAAE